jgi:nucleoside-diphosphate-sugar epimerase
MGDGLPLVVVQPGVIYGEGDHSPMRPLLDAYVRRRLPAVPRGAAYCWGYVDDTVDGHLRAMERGRAGESYVIAGPRHTLADALRIAEHVCGIPAPRLEVPAALLRAAAALTTLAGQDAEGLRVLAGVTYLASSAKAERELGFAARPLDEGLARVLPGLIADRDRRN